MNTAIQTIRQLLRDKIPVNIVTIEDEKYLRTLFNFPKDEVTFKLPYDRQRVNITVGFTKEDIKEILKDRPNIDTILLNNEYLTLSEINILSQGKELLPVYDDPADTTPAEEKALNSDLNYPGETLRENLKIQCKIPTSRAARITGKYIDNEHDIL